jgi:PKD repeat protein
MIHPSRKVTQTLLAIFISLVSILAFCGEAIVPEACTLTCTGTAAPASGEVPLQVLFEATATASGCQGALSFDWDFGDGTPHSTARRPLHVYLTPGNYTWKLTASLSGSTCTQSGTVTANNYAGSFHGVVAISDGQALYPITGGGISNGTVYARNASGGMYTRIIREDGVFAFTEIPSGTYTV